MGDKKMKAALLEKTGPIEDNPLLIKDIPLPDPKRGQVLLKIEGCGVCRSNLHLIEGDWLSHGVPRTYPIIPGHEIVGTIESVNDGAAGTSLRVGDRVGVQPLFSTCGACEFCVSGREELCAQKKSTGETVDGGYAEYMVADSAHVYHVPENLKSEQAAPLFCPGVTAYSAVKKANLNPSDKVAVVGVGGVGQMVIQFAKLYGSEVTAIDNVSEHLEMADELGADSTLNSRQSQDFSKELLGSGGVDKSLIFAPSSKAASETVKGTKPGGTIIMGVFAGIDEFPFADEKVIVGSVIGSREPMKEVLQIASRGRLKLPVEVFKLDGANDALKRLKDGKIRSRAVLVP
jgi:alcohol dehydrogenase, propanol-preferring